MKTSQKILCFALSAMYLCTMTAGMALSTSISDESVISCGNEKYETENGCEGCKKKKKN